MVHNHEILFRKSQKHALSSNPYKLSVLMVLCQKNVSLYLKKTWTANTKQWSSTINYCATIRETALDIFYSWYCGNTGQCSAHTNIQNTNAANSWINMMNFCPTHLFTSCQYFIFYSPNRKHFVILVYLSSVGTGAWGRTNSLKTNHC